MANTVAYGFVGLKHLFDERITKVGVEEIWRAVQDSAAEHSRQMDALLASVVERTTAYKERAYLPGDATLQPLDEYGNPKPVRPSGYYDVAYPIHGAGYAWGTNRVSRELMTVQEANRYTLDAQRADADWMRRHILAALLDETAWTYPDDEYGDLTIEPLANGDTVVYVRKGGVAATDDHYLAQAAAIDDSNNPYNDIYDDLAEHPSNAGPYVAYIPTNLKTVTEGLTNFIEVADPDIVPGNASDVLRNNGEAIKLFGDEVLGKTDHLWIVEWKSLPDNYIVSFALGTQMPVVMQREYPVTPLQGYFPEFHSPDGNRQINRLLRYCGFGVQNRVGALVYMIGNATYSTPASYDAPLAV